MDLILYHAHCPDGWCAAYIASKKYPEAELVPLDHGLSETQIEDLFKKCEGSDVLMVDYSLHTRELNDRLNEFTKEFQIYDHHKTAQTVLEGAPYAIFDMKRSGAGITWDYLFGKNSGILWQNHRTGEEEWGLCRPWYVNYVEDRDLWNWALPNSREICAYLGTLELNKESWDKLDRLKAEDGLAQGIGAFAHISHYVREAVKQAQTGTLYIDSEIEGVVLSYKTAVLNIPYLNCSEIGNELAKTHEVSLTWFEHADGIIQFSLRSIGDIDVSVIAKSFNGGGHKNAAGFQIPIDEGRQLVDKILGRNLVRLEKLKQQIEIEMKIREAKILNELSRSSGGCIK